MAEAVGAQERSKIVCQSRPSIHPLASEILNFIGAFAPSASRFNLKIRAYSSCTETGLRPSRKRQGHD